MEIVGFDPIESSKMSFGLIPKVLYSFDVILSAREDLEVVDWDVIKVAHVEMYCIS